jgi:hypothetical protein
MRCLHRVSVAVLAAAAHAGCGGGVPTHPDAALRFYKVSLHPIGANRAEGVAFIDAVGGDLRVRVHATGVEPGGKVPQHIHANPGCDPGGPVVLNLDAGLTVPGEGPGAGAAGTFPVASAEGRIDYEARRSLDEIRSALATWGGPTLADTDDLLDYLELTERSVQLHVAFGPPFPAVTCGGVEQIH